jgi:drug/metabolite transporter (DMT)-like permease
MSSQLYRSYSLLVLTMLIWAGGWVSGKLVTTTVPPFTAGFIQYLPASILLLGLTLLTRPKPAHHYGRAQFKGFALLGLTGFFGYSILFFVGVRLTTAGQGVIISGFSPAAVSIFAYILDKEVLDSRWQYFGLVVSFVGIIFVIGIQAVLDFQPSYTLGNLIILASMFSWGLYSAIGKRVTQTVSPLEAITGAAITGTIMFAVGATFEQFWSLPGLQSPLFWFNILYLGVLGSFVGDTLYLQAVSRIGPTRTGVFLNLVPIFGVVLSALILNESIYWSFIIGMILIIAGILIINHRPKSMMNSDSSPIAGARREQTATN